MTLRRRLIALLAAVCLVGTAGCVQLPKPVTATTAPRPSMTRTAAAALVHRYVRVDRAAWKKHDPTQLPEVLTGAELSQEAAHILWAKRSSDTSTRSHAEPDAGYTVSCTPGGHYPALAVIVGVPRTKTAENWFYLAERASAREPWRISFTSGAELNTFRPGLSDRHDHVFTPVAARTRVNGLTVNAVPGLAAKALQSPSGPEARRFVADSMFNDAKAKPEKKIAHRTESIRYDPGPWRHGYLTETGDLIVFGQFSQTRRFQFHDDYYIHFTGEAQRKVLPGNYAALTYTSSATFVVRVPRKGKLSVLTSYWVLRDVSGTPYVPS